VFLCGRHSCLMFHGVWAAPWAASSLGDLLLFTPTSRPPFVYVQFRGLQCTVLIIWCHKSECELKPVIWHITSECLWPLAIRIGADDGEWPLQWSKQQTLVLGKAPSFMVNSCEIPTTLLVCILQCLYCLFDEEIEAQKADGNFHNPYNR
jgi:hypothetical protein